jgi:hypothetical protein
VLGAKWLTIRDQCSRKRWQIDLTSRMPGSGGGEKFCPYFVMWPPTILWWWDEATSRQEAAPVLGMVPSPWILCDFCSHTFNSTNGYRVVLTRDKPHVRDHRSYRKKPHAEKSLGEKQDSAFFPASSSSETHLLSSQMGSTKNQVHHLTCWDKILRGFMKLDHLI